MFGGVFSNTWAKQQHAEAHVLTNGRKNAEETPWGRFVLETIKRDNTILNSSGLYHPQGYHWLLFITHLLPSWSINDLQKEFSDKHPLKSVEVSEIGLGAELTNQFNEISRNLITSENELKIDLSNLNFPKEVVFSNFIFPIDVDFSNTKFFENVYFNDAVFCETANFEDAEFQESTSHSKETAKFRNTTFKKIANFRNATFWGYANFKGAKLEGRAFFQEAKFKCHAPRFYDSVFNNEITWAGIKLPDFANAPVDNYDTIGNKIILADYNKTIKNHGRRIEENQNAYENTSILLEETNKYHDRYLFFRAEMRCRRHLEKNVFMCLAFWFYQIFADYGYGVGLALFWWFLHIILGAIAIFIISSGSGLGFEQLRFCSISTSFANANPFVFIGIKDGTLMACYTKFQIFSPVGFGYVKGIQTIIGIPLLFLLLTTLRVRFRLNTKT